MELNHLRAFYDVAKCGQFSQAAKRGAISQSALSRSVALLEAAEGVVLLERSKKGVVLTPTGKEVYSLCEQLFGTAKEIENLCRGVKEKCEGPLPFAATDHVINDFLVKPIHEFRREFPKVIPSILSGTPDEIIESLLKSENEFALLFSKIDAPQIVYTRVRSEVMSLICHPDLWRKYKASTNEKTLKNIINNVGYLCSIGSLSQSRPSRVLLELFGESPRIGLETNSQEAQKRFCIAGEGVAYLARFMVKSEIEAGKLFEIPVASPHLFHLWLARKKGHNLSLAARRFLQSISPEGGI